MSGIEHPYFLIAIRDEWITNKIGPELFAGPAFCCIEDARRYAEHDSKEKGTLLSLYRFVEYLPTGNVIEG